MKQAKKGDTVKIHYTGTLEDGTQFANSIDKEPAEFALGSAQAIPGINKAVEGMAVGEKKTVTIPPEDAYGPRLEDMVQEVSRSALPQDLVPAVGMGLQAKGPDGKQYDLLITEVGEETITVDANHLLAGKALCFDIELVAIA